jgi:hypothetical protein
MAISDWQMNRFEQILFRVALPHPAKTVELRSMAAELRRDHGRGK